MSRTRADIPSDRPRQTSDGVGGGQLFELPALDPVLIWCLVSTFVFGLVAHGYRMGAAAFSHDSLIIDSHVDFAHQVGIGRFMQVPVWVLRGYINAPFLLGVIALLWLALSLWLAMRLLGIRDRSLVALACGAVTTCVTFSASYATYAPMIDIYMLALLCATLAVVTLRRLAGWRGACVSAALLVCAMGLYQSYAEVFTVLVVLDAIARLCRREAPRAQVVRDGLRAVLALVLGAVAYMLTYRVTCALSACPAISDAPNSVGGALVPGPLQLLALLGGAYAHPFAFLLHYQGWVFRLVYLLLACCVVACLSVRLRREAAPASDVALCVAGLALLPLMMNWEYVVTRGFIHDLMTFSYAYFFVLVALSLQLCFEAAPAAHADVHAHAWLSAVPPVVMILLALVTLNQTVFANQLYLNKRLQEQTALSYYTRVIDRMETTDGYVAGQTKVAFVGTSDKSPLTFMRPGYEGVSPKGYEGTTGMAAWAVGTYYGTYEFYLENVLGYPVNMVSEGQVASLSRTDEVESMGAFPAKDSCRFVGDVLVVKVGE